MNNGQNVIRWLPDATERIGLGEQHGAVESKNEGDEEVGNGDDKDRFKVLGELSDQPHSKQVGAGEEEEEDDGDEDLEEDLCSVCAAGL